MKRLKSTARKSLRVLIVGITCCCLSFLALHTYYSPSSSLPADSHPVVLINRGLEIKIPLNKASSLKHDSDNSGKEGKNIHQELDNVDFDTIFRNFDLINNAEKRIGNENSVHQTSNEYPPVARNELKYISALDEKADVQNSSIYTKMGRKRHTFRRSRYDPVPRWTKILYYDRQTPPSLFNQWNNNRQDFCDERFSVYMHEFAHLHNVMVDRRYCTCALKGGEFIENVLRQTEEAEYYKFEMGCFRLDCHSTSGSSRPSYYFNSNNHLNDWMYSLAFHPLEESGVADEETTKQPIVQPLFTIAVTRYEYANLYHTMTDWYNAFLMMQFFNQTPATTNILIVDSHPFGQLDSTWSQLFNSTRRLSAIAPLSVFPNLIWATLGYNSPMTTYITSAIPPLYEEFRDFFLSSYAMDASSHKLNCSNLSVLFIWRRDYLAHPRNPSGTISRKIANEVQLVNVVRHHNPTFTVTGAQIDLLPVREQLDIITRTDVLVGMHGAGLTHTVFLPRHSALVELVPSYWSATAEHFESIAQWRGLVYEKWINNDPLRDIDEKLTMVPPNIVNALLRKVAKRLCGDIYKPDDLDEWLGKSNVGEESKNSDLLNRSRTAVNDFSRDSVNYNGSDGLYSRQNSYSGNDIFSNNSTRLSINQSVPRERNLRPFYVSDNNRSSNSFNKSMNYIRKGKYFQSHKNTSVTKVSNSSVYTTLAVDDSVNGRSPSNRTKSRYRNRLQNHLQRAHPLNGISLSNDTSFSGEHLLQGVSKWQQNKTIKRLHRTRHRIDSKLNSV